jgi:hypothetical protein
MKGDAGVGGCAIGSMTSSVTRPVRGDSEVSNTNPLWGTQMLIVTTLVV